MKTNKPLMLVEDDRPDVQIWNDTINNSKSLVDKNKVASFTGAWLVVECYMYRKIYEAFALRLVRVMALQRQSPTSKPAVIYRCYFSV